MPIDAALPFRFARDTIYHKVNNAVLTQRLLKQRWEETNPQDKVRTLGSGSGGGLFAAPESNDTGRIDAP